MCIITQHFALHVNTKHVSYMHCDVEIVVWHSDWILSLILGKLVKHWMQCSHPDIIGGISWYHVQTLVNIQRNISYHQESSKWTLEIDQKLVRSYWVSYFQRFKYSGNHIVSFFLFTMYLQVCELCYKPKTVPVVEGQTHSHTKSFRDFRDEFRRYGWDKDLKDDEYRCLFLLVWN